ncbi:MAG: hypothetical protein QOC66_2588 [Pseudonocardiales bacterium]|jgi:hypothetical protein|nr:hypothetical protein [Pseudonocardiales bacterium]
MLIGMARRSWGAASVDLRRHFSKVAQAAKSLVRRLLGWVVKAEQVRIEPRFENARGPGVRDLRCLQRRLSPHDAFICRAV